MARITVEDCLDKQNNRFALISLAAKRAKQLLNGADSLLDRETDNKSVVNALREIAAGKVTFMSEEDLAERKAIEDAKKAELVEKHKAASSEEIGADLFNDLELLQRAYDYADEKHAGQVRASGEPYFIHLEATALLVCQLKLDIASVVAALLHDVIEDCDVNREEIESEFSPDIAHIVEGVTNLTRLEFESREAKQAESFRKMLLAMSRDIRVVLVKLCDRLHNMRTLEYVTTEKQRRKSIEVKEIYAPLANRLGIHWLKSELEDISFRYLRPELYNDIFSNLALSEQGREDFINATNKELTRSLEEAGVSASVKGRSKHLFSIWNKMERQNLTFEEVHDLIGFRIIVPTLRSCYETLGIIHAKFKPVPGRFKDYIAMPKPNLYQSLHTTVIGTNGNRIEIQIRTPDMHRIAEQGIAAHWRYKEG
ncbi:UNVERIFIED_CONTAM: hypothetical protein GTU68_018192, partial [Idotea baltica]|nr:hypothetical protein [Idotea baltica]